MYSGTVGSGKTYHAVEDIVDALNKGKYVIANFPLVFNARQVKRGIADRFMYLPDEHLMGVTGMKMLLDVSREHGWDQDEKEGLCLVVIDEATNYFPREDNTKPEQRLWRTFFTQSRKLGYDFVLIVQDDQSINRTISKCIEYDVKHRKANNIFPFSLLSFLKITIFVHVTYWKQQRTRLKSGSTIFVKKLSEMFATKKMFANFDGQLDVIMKSVNTDELPSACFGNCRPDEDVDSGRGPREGAAVDIPSV
ncbi:zonular occludens toxin domain-containing protein [Paenibacillus alvei]|uniref:zonular occludens toxin domain-containing protein n=1 Tax=Paenibacillus alvei TaxID=44250 RepID=UPI001F50A2AC|nr:zonular occludens toxin domain-containing protein [Paenibacillus alvei]MCY9543468.1 zonular occludens toxin domain-containing protein [Paenibacillus alvei]MEC0082257.1 zonular occludens toxin domain-containing protein [Paenibacillus alvei]